MFKREQLTLEYAKDAELRYVWKYLNKFCLVDNVFCSDDLKTYEDFDEILLDSLVFTARYFGEIAGIIWLNTFENKTARIHFFVLSPARRILITGGREVIGRLLDWNDMKAFYGFVPEWNKSAIKYYRKLGFKDFGIIPDLAYDQKKQTRGNMSCSYINKEIFNG